VFLRFSVEAEVNFFRREKLSRRDYLDYLKKRAKSGDTAFFEFMFRYVKIDPATGVIFARDFFSVRERISTHRT